MIRLTSIHRDYTLFCFYSEQFTYAHEPLEKNWNGKNATFSGNDVPKRAKFMKTFLLKTEKFRPKTVQTAARRVVSDEGKAISMCAY